MVEIIAQIIMGKDVALRSAAAVAVEGVDRSVHPAPRAPRASDAAERPAVAHEQVEQRHRVGRRPFALLPRAIPADRARQRSEEHTSELQSLMRISYAVFCLKKKRTKH